MRVVSGKTDKGWVEFEFISTLVDLFGLAAWDWIDQPATVIAVLREWLMSKLSRKIARGVGKKAASNNSTAWAGDGSQLVKVELAQDRRGRRSAGILRRYFPRRTGSELEGRANDVMARAW